MANKFIKFLTKSTPIEKEKDILMDHEYDGIQELDNKLPPWWLWLLYITIAIAAVYMIRYHVIGGSDAGGEWKTGKIEIGWPVETKIVYLYRSPEFGGWSSSSEWEEEMAAAKVKIDAYRAEQGDVVNENTVTLLDSEEVLAQGLEIFTTNCVACHKADGGGLIGPNLTDEYWIHGGDIKNLFNTIKYGVPEKGMISWKTQMKPEQMQAVASYILVKLQGTNPEGGKAPEGEKYVPEITSDTTVPADSTELTKETTVE